LDWRLGTAVDLGAGLVVEWRGAAGPGGGKQPGGGYAMSADTAAAETELTEFGILGPLEVSRRGRAVPLAGPRQRAVLALLLLEANRAVSMDRLAEDIWGGEPPDGWITTLQTYVFHLRQALEPGRARGAGSGILVTRGRGYLLRVDREHLDAARFQDGLTAGRAALEAGRYAEAAGTLRGALELWRGGVLADLADYAFTRPEAARLEELRLAALEARIDADLAMGGHSALTGELGQLAAKHPLREGLHGQLMLALYRCGRQADALAAYRRARLLLASELGIDPGEALQRLHASVLVHDPALDWRSDHQAPADGHRPGTGTPVASPPPAPPPRPGAPVREPDQPRRRTRRLLAIGLALAVAAIACVAIVARPWAGEPAGLSSDSVSLISPSGARVGGPVNVASPAGLAYGDGAVWTVDSSNGTLDRIDPATHALLQIPVGSAPSAVAITGPDAWVTNSGDGTVSRVSTVTNRAVETIPVGSLPVAIAAGSGGVWVANQGDNTVDRIDPVTGEVTTKGGIQVGARPDGLAAGAGGVWVANGEDGTIQRIDPATGQPDGPVHVGSGPAGIAVTPGAVWVANSLDLTVMKIDPAAGKVTAIIPAGDGPTTLAVDGDSLWVSDEFGATLDRIDLHANRVDRRIHLGSSPRGMAVTRSGVWIASRPFPPASHRGGTLTVVDYILPLTDPVADYDGDNPVLGVVYDGLTAFRRSGGGAGLTLVPDLATTLPRPAAGGTTYTFTLRRGIRYSTGRLVRASDFRRALQRELSVGAASTYYEGIHGGSACLQHPKQCDLSAGIVTDDGAGTVTFHLTQADPDFLDKLALNFAAPAPPGTPDRVISRAPFLPGTGPYMISQARLGQSVTVVRNPYFRQWSYAAQPAGYVSVIRYEHVADESAQESTVIADQADLALLLSGGDQSLAVRYPARVYNNSDLKHGTALAALNTRVPPFTNIKAREAVNYAVDREKIIQLYHFAAGQATASCQVLPLDFPGHQSYCPYTTGGEDGAWHAPDMAKARQLVSESGTKNVPVTILSSNYAPAKAAGSYLVGLLNELGYRTSLHVVSSDQLYASIGNPRDKTQISVGEGYAPDFPTPSSIFGPLLSCQSADEPGTTNWARFCDPHLDALASQALAAQLTDPAAARGLWAQADRTVTDQAPYVPFFNFSKAGVVSSRVGNYQQSPVYGPLLSQLWVR
jgi:YVTN family beta-propeller protein